MSTSGLLNHYPFISVMPQSYPINNFTSSNNLVQFPANASPFTMAALSSMPFINPCDLAPQLMSPASYNFVNDLDFMNGEKFPGDNIPSLRIIMSGKEVGSIIGKRGDNIKRFREESMARINISDGNSPERIVTISGSCEQIHHAVGLMCRKLEDDVVKASDFKLSESNAPVLSIRLLIQPVQYNGIIGNGGGRMTQLSEMTDATILFGVEFLPNSSERLLTISGSSESISICILELCKIFNEMPLDTYIVPYSPKVITYPGIQQTTGTNSSNKMTSPTFSDNIAAPAATSLPILPIQSMYPQSFYSADQMAFPFGLSMSLVPLKIPNPLSPFMQKAAFDSVWKSPSNPGPIPQQNISREFFVENEMIGCIIGRGGSTINEIRAISGAQIKISNCEDGKQERRINICGPFDSVQTAQLLINSSLELYKQSVKLKATANTNGPIILTNPLLASNIQQNNFLQFPQQPFFAFNSQLKPDMNISLFNSVQNPESGLMLTSISPGSVDYDSLDRYVSKMKSTQVHLDGSNISVMKFKPY